tara:strand:- start:287 stop:1366 length:1080 start_codon:yes stop_codon:yes gene_type:complete
VGDDKEILKEAASTDLVLLAQACSASCMWTANAATISPSSDTNDGRVHLTPANLIAQFHRSIETSQTARALKAAFPDTSMFAHHDPLPASTQFGDEGAANHTRLATTKGFAHLFVYGAEHRRPDAARPTRFPARQTLEASEAVARRHGVGNPIFIQQNPDVIDQGVFHNDVISVGTGRVLLYHEQAFLDNDRTMERIAGLLGDDFTPLMVSEDMVSVDDCVSTYLFNSQLLERADGSMILVAPIECRENQSVHDLCRKWCEEDNPIQAVEWMDVRESMHNGGGPACLRLRVPLNERERAAVHPSLVLTPSRADQLETWIQKWYPESLHPEQLSDPNLYDQCHAAMAELEQLLEFPIIPA